MQIDVQVPEWANWIAQEPNGVWFVFENKPNCATHWAGWVAAGHRTLLAKGHPPADWTQELYEIEWK